MKTALKPANGDVYAVVLAGGSGSRFWPKSRHLKPKQLCKIGPALEPMITATLSRLDGFVPPERRLIITHEDQAGKTREMVGDKVRAVVEEPCARNTAAALALAASHIESYGEAVDPVMISNHADAMINDATSAPFIKCLGAAVEIARMGKLTTVGVVPRYAETGYGYIEKGEAFPHPTSAGNPAAFTVASFKEKPSRELAQKYLESDTFLWNTGIFAWKTKIFLTELGAQLPRIVDAVSQPNDPVHTREAYKEIPKISIDHALLETSRNVAVVAADIAWHDVGSWDALHRLFPVDDRGNYVNGDAFVDDCNDVTIDSDGPFVAALGVKGLVIVHANDALLVCPRQRSQEVKRVVEHLQKTGRDQLV